MQKASIFNGGQQTNQIKNVLKFIQKLWKHCQLTKDNFKGSAFPDGNVINLSKHSFTKIQFKVLHKNLNFCPTPGYYNKKEVKTDIKNFERKIKLKSFFELKKQDKPNKNNNTSSAIPNIKAKSTWEPPKNCHTINTFIEAPNNDVDELFKHKQTLHVTSYHNMKRAL